MEDEIYLFFEQGRLPSLINMILHKKTRRKWLFLDHF